MYTNRFGKHILLVTITLMAVILTADAALRNKVPSGPTVRVSGIDPNDEGDRSFSTPPDDWKSYSNPIYRFAFLYPPSWKLVEPPVDTQSPFQVTLRSPDGRRRLSIYPINPGRQSVFDLGNRSVLIQPFIFQGKAARLYECPTNNPCPSQLVFGKAIRLTTLPESWEATNEIAYEIYADDESVHDTIELVLSTFVFVD